ncbi:MAG TPA: high-affinity branched-chain amino acid ABC transporter ATP-binding protein LivG, partial [Sedimentibacter sp.]|nr:high-affinity branched-chain amino acid ABC transporter ATP-binding protein LivG [Sedimentibacter sp.]
FNVISGVYTADKGSVILDGQNITKLPQHEITKLGIGRTFQNIRLFKGLSTIENVMCAFDPQSKYGFIDSILPTPKRMSEEKRALELCKH